MKKFNLSLIYTLLISTTASSTVFAMNAGEGDAQKSTRPKVSAVEKMSAPSRQKADEQSNVRSARKSTKVQGEPEKTTGNLNNPYPDEWKNLDQASYFSILESEKDPSPQLVVEWSKGILDKLLCWEKTSSAKRIGIFAETISRSLCLLGKKAKENEEVRHALRHYFAANQKFLKSWYTAASEALNGKKSTKYPFPNQDLINILSAHGQLGLIWPNEFGKVWSDVVKKKLETKEFNAEQLVNVFYEQAKLGLPVDEEFQMLWCNAAFEKLTAKEFDHQQMANILYGHALIGVAPVNLEFRQRFFIQIEYTILDIFKKKKSNDRCLHSIYLGLKYFDKFENLHKKTKSKYYKWLKDLKNSDKPSASNTQENVGNRLKGDSMLDKLVKQPVSEEVWFDELGRSVDFLIKDYEQGLDVIIEVDGPDHFIGDSKIVKPKTRVHDHILKTSKGNRKVIVHLPYFELDYQKGTNKLNQAQKSNSYIRDKIRMALEAEKAGAQG